MTFVHRSATTDRRHEIAYPTEQPSTAVQSCSRAASIYAACQPAASGRTTTATSVTRGLCSLGVRGVALAVRQSVARSSRINAAGRQVFDGCRSMRLRRGRPVAPARPPAAVYTPSLQTSSYEDPSVVSTHLTNTDRRIHWRQPPRGCWGHPQFFGWGDVNGNRPIPPILLRTFGYSRTILVILRSFSLKPISCGYKTPQIRFSQAGGQSAHKARPHQP